MYIIITISHHSTHACQENTNQTIAELKNSNCAMHRKTGPNQTHESVTIVSKWIDMLVFQISICIQLCRIVCTNCLVTIVRTQYRTIGIYAVPYVWRLGLWGFPPYKESNKLLEMIRCFSCLKLCNFQNTSVVIHYLFPHPYSVDLLYYQAVVSDIHLYPCFHCVFVCIYLSAPTHDHVR